jgi:lipopolysaccharide transport system ATP-binding protein
MIAQGAGLDMEASGLQNIRKLGAMRMLSKKVIESRIDSIVEFSELGDFVRLPVKTYSSGMMARLMFACATEFEADILVLDEWLGAGDASFFQKASDRMQGFVDKAQMVVLGTHNFGLVERVCNKVIELSAGRAVFYGSTKDWAAWRNR